MPQHVTDANGALNNGTNQSAHADEGISDELTQKVSFFFFFIKIDLLNNCRFLIFNKNKLQDKSASLTQLRKQKSKILPEGLASTDDIKSFKCVGSNTVSLFDWEKIWTFPQFIF